MPVSKDLISELQGKFVVFQKLCEQGQPEKSVLIFFFFFLFLLSFSIVPPRDLLCWQKEIKRVVASAALVGSRTLNQKSSDGHSGADGQPQILFSTLHWQPGLTQLAFHRTLEEAKKEMG